MCPENFTDAHRRWGAGETGHHVVSESLILLVIKDKHTSHPDLCTLVLDRKVMESHRTGRKGQAQCCKSGIFVRPVSSDSLSLSRSGQAGTLLSAFSVYREGTSQRSLEIGSEGSQKIILDCDDLFPGEA